MTSPCESLRLWRLLFPRDDALDRPWGLRLDDTLRLCTAQAFLSGSGLAFGDSLTEGLALRNGGEEGRGARPTHYSTLHSTSLAMRGRQCGL